MTGKTVDCIRMDVMTFHWSADYSGEALSFAFACRRLTLMKLAVVSGGSDRDLNVLHMLIQ